MHICVKYVQSGKKTRVTQKKSNLLNIETNKYYFNVSNTWVIIFSTYFIKKLVYSRVIRPYGHTKGVYCLFLSCTLRVVPIRLLTFEQALKYLVSKGKFGVTNFLRQIVYGLVSRVCLPVFDVKIKILKKYGLRQK